MEPKQIDFMINKHGIENLLFISINNNKRIFVDDEVRKNLVFDHTNLLLQIKDKHFVQNEMRNFKDHSDVTYYHPYATLETFVWKDKK